MKFAIANFQLPIFKWFKKATCRHEFRLRDLTLTNHPKPPEPALNGYSAWLKYFSSLDQSDWHLKRVRWSCCRCGQVFEAQCGLDILRHGKVVE